jgi:hypothetical protein
MYYKCENFLITIQNTEDEDDISDEDIKYEDGKGLGGEEGED